MKPSLTIGVRRTRRSKAAARLSFDSASACLPARTRAQPQSLAPETPNPAKQLSINSRWAHRYRLYYDAGGASLVAQVLPRGCLRSHVYRESSPYRRHLLSIHLVHRI